MDLILKAAQFAKTCHATQTRKHTGDPYIFHPGRVAARVSILQDATEEMVAAAWLHDVVEDCGIFPHVIVELFGARVASLVADLTNEFTTARHPDKNRAERKLLEGERLKLISDEAKRIKMLDRIDNLKETDTSAANASYVKLYTVESLALAADIGSADAALHAELLRTIIAVSGKVK